MVSANFKVNGFTVPDYDNQIVIAGQTVSLALTDTTGVKGVVWEFFGRSRDDLNYPTITRSGHPQGVTASFVMPTPLDSEGLCLLIRCTVNGGRDQTGAIDTDLTSTSGVGIINGLGIIPFAVGETYEFNTELGWSKRFNEGLNVAGGGSSNATQLLGKALDTVTLTTPATGVIMQYNGTKWVASSALVDGVTYGHALVWSGTAWGEGAELVADDIILGSVPNVPANGQIKGGAVLAIQARNSADTQDRLIIDWENDQLLFGNILSATDIDTMAFSASNILSAAGTLFAVAIGADTIISCTGTNLSLFDTTGSFGSGSGVVFVKNRTTAPTTDPTGGGILYSEGGELFWRSSAGVVTQLTP